MLRQFLEMFGQIVENVTPLLEDDRYLILVIGDKFNKGEWIPLGHLTMLEVLKKGYMLKSTIVKNIEKTSEDNTPIPTTFTILKTSAVIPTIKLAKVIPTKVPNKRVSAVLGVVTTPTPNITIVQPSGTKLKTNLPWEEIKFWGMGLMALLTTSWVVVLDKRVI